MKEFYLKQLFNHFKTDSKCVAFNVHALLLLPECHIRRIGHEAQVVVYQVNDHFQSLGFTYFENGHLNINQSVTLHATSIPADCRKPRLFLRSSELVSIELPFRFSVNIYSCSPYNILLTACKP